MMINVHRAPRTATTGNRVDPSVIRKPVKVQLGACLACASGSRVAKHTH